MRPNEMLSLASSDWLPMLVLAAWFVAQRWVLPRLGVGT